MGYATIFLWLESVLIIKYTNIFLRRNILKGTKMAFFNKLFGYRWSLYIVINDKELVYAMHENSVIRMLGYVMGYFSMGNNPIIPWSLYLNFNHTNKVIKLNSNHFSLNGENITQSLSQEIASIDSGWKVKGNEPVFEEVRTKNKLKITSLNNNELTFYKVMDQVFGK